MKSCIILGFLAFLLLLKERGEIYFVAVFTVKLKAIWQFV